MRKAYDLAYWDAPKIVDALAHVRNLKLGMPKRMRMSAFDFADLRKFASSVLDVNTKAGDLRLGLMGVMYGMSIYLDRSMTQGVVGLFGPDDLAISHVVNPRRWSDRFVDEGHSLSFHPGEFVSCPEGLCLSMLVMGS